MRALPRTLLTLTALVAMGPVACVPISEPIADRPLDRPVISGNWKGAAGLDTIRLQLVEYVTEDKYHLSSVDGTGTYSQAATGNSWPLGVSGSAHEIWLSDEAQMRRIFRVRAIGFLRLTGMLFVVSYEDRGQGVVEQILQDSMPFSLRRQQ